MNPFIPSGPEGACNDSVEQALGAAVGRPIHGLRGSGAIAALSPKMPLGYQGDTQKHRGINEALDGLEKELAVLAETLNRQRNRLEPLCAQVNKATQDVEKGLAMGGSSKLVSRVDTLSSGVRTLRDQVNAQLDRLEI